MTPPSPPLQAFCAPASPSGCCNWPSAWPTFSTNTRSTAPTGWTPDRKSTRLNSSHLVISYAVFCLKKKKYNDVRWPPDEGDAHIHLGTQKLCLYRDKSVNRIHDTAISDAHHVREHVYQHSFVHLK